MKTRLFLVLIVVLNTFILKAEEPSLTFAWNAYNSENYKEAIKYAEQCIDDFGKRALKIQYNLDSLKIVPETGSVNDIQKERILKNDLLNDVSTSCFIKGRSAEKLYALDKSKNSKYKQIATDAYKLACKYSKGRCWDTKGYFWSPCESSSGRLPIE